MKFSFSLLLASIALPFAYSADKFDFRWNLVGPICGDEDMQIMADRVAATLEVLGSSYLQEHDYGKGSNISDVQITVDPKDDRKLNAEDGISEVTEEDKARDLQTWSWPYGGGQGTCQGCPPDDDDRRELMGKGLLGKMLESVDDIAPEFISKDISENVSDECLKIAGKRGKWSVIFSM